MSSVHVYGSDIEGLTENNKLCSTHPYAASKIETEKLIESNLNETNTNYLVLRLSKISFRSHFDRDKILSFTSN